MKREITLDDVPAPGEPLTMRTLIAAAIIIGSVVIITTYRAKQPAAVVAPAEA